MLKSTGIVRKLDELGRITLPIELRKNLNIKEKDGLEIFVEADTIILKKYEPSCIFCGNEIRYLKKSTQLIFSKTQNSYIFQPSNSNP